MLKYTLTSIYLDDKWIKEVIKIFKYVIVVEKRMLVEEDYS
jgi:hypothetical protein